MDGKKYFESTPWTQACSSIKSQDLGDILHISVQGVYEKGTIHKQLQDWETRVEELAGKKQRGDLIEAGRAVSFLGVFGNDVIVRFFFDEGTDGLSENFEVVTTKALLVWKPNVTNQGHMLSQDGCFIEASQQYVVELGESIC